MRFPSKFLCCSRCDKIPLEYSYGLYSRGHPNTAYTNSHFFNSSAPTEEFTLSVVFDYLIVPSFSEKHHEEVCLGNLRRFQFRELQIATDNFSSKHLLGKGGFGNVYKGHLQDGNVVAVKRLKDGNAAGGDIQFQTEVEMISLAVHRNLLKLCGFCMTATERLLVYPYMSNGSVASRLKGNKQSQISKS